MEEIPGSEFTVNADLVFLAMGFLHVEHGKLTNDLEVALDDKEISRRMESMPHPFEESLSREMP